MQPDAQTCSIDFSGDFSANATATACASIQNDDAGEAELVVDTTAAGAGRVRVNIVLNGAPSSGTLTSDVVSSWSALALGFGDAGCVFAAGSATAPNGSFQLTFASGGEGSVLHGALTFEMEVQAPPGADCGPADSETVHVAF